MSLYPRLIRSNFNFIIGEAIDCGQTFFAFLYRIFFKILCHQEMLHVSLHFSEASCESNKKQQQNLY